MFNWLWRACLAASVGAACLAGYELTRHTAGTFTVDPTLVEPFDRPVGAYDLTFRVVNASSRAVAVVGLEAG